MVVAQGSARRVQREQYYRGILSEDIGENNMDHPSQEEDPWKAAAERVRERDTAAALADFAIMSDYERRQREAAERTAEGQRRIEGFLSRMRDAGNPGCGEHNLTTPNRRRNMMRRRADGAGEFKDEDPDELIVQGWVIEDRSFRAHPRDSVSDQGDWHESRTVLTVDGIAFDKPDRSPGGGFGRARVDPADITIDMLAETLIRNGVEL